MKLIIAEKPSVGMTIANVVGATKREDGYIIGRLLCQENNGKWEFELDYKE